ncbi:ComEC/Rec2 family competence protein [Limnohabitans sp.]
MFSVTALPASFGDCLWIEYGPIEAPYALLIDAGPSAPSGLKARLQDLAARQGKLELVVVTHVDADHIGGMLTLLENDFYGVPVRDFWFNAFRHLPGETFGEKQGERLTGLLLEKKVTWNAELNNAALMVGDGDYPQFSLPGGAVITLLSPDAGQLAALKRKWIDVCGEADLYVDIPATTTFYGEEGREHFGGLPNVKALCELDFKEDATEANGSSIAFVLEYEGKRVLLGADAFPSRLIASLGELYGDMQHRFDLVKVPHHGSEKNVSKDFVEALKCPRYLFSSNGARYKHPSRAAVARVIAFGNKPKLLFNYRTEFNEMWASEMLMQLHGYAPFYGDKDQGIEIRLIP